MAEDKRWGELADTPFAPFVPVVLLVVAVVLLMSTNGYGIFGLYAIFSAFVGGAALVGVSVILLFLPDRFAGTELAGASFLLGVSLGVSAALLYLVYGCVFGCLG